jgi:hypothetical protein
MKKKIMAFIVFAMSLGIASAQQPAVQVSTAPGWHKISTTTVDLKNERDEIMVLGADRFSALKFMVMDAPISLQDLEIWFENGTKQDVQLREQVEMGKETRVVNIDGGPKDINKIVLVYKTVPNSTNEKAQLTIYGLKPENMSENRMKDTDKDRNVAVGENRADKDVVNADVNRADETKNKDNAAVNDRLPAPKVQVSDKTGWHKIAETTVSFTKEQDEVMVLGADRYAKLKFKATDAGIIISDMTISYEDGTRHDIAVASTFNVGEESRVIDVPGAEKDIARISFIYKTVPNQNKDKAHLEIWGYKSNADRSTGLR